MALLLDNSILKAAEAKLESQLTPAVRANYNRVVVAGMKAGLEGGPDSILAHLTKSKDPVSDCAVGAVNLTLLLQKQARGTIPFPALVPAAMTLMLHALDFADRGKIVKVDNEVLVQASHIFADTIMKHFNIGTPFLRGMAGKLRTIMQNPQQKAQMEQEARRGL